MPTRTAHAVLQHIADLERQAARLERLQGRLHAGHFSAVPANAARKAQRGPRRRRRRRRR
jgi:hypothetical protein